MPYEIKPVKGGYFVVNTKNNKKYSKKPIPKSNADKQIKVLRMIEGKKK